MTEIQGRCYDRDTSELSAYLDGECSRREEVEAHLASCPACRQSLSELETCSRLVAAGTETEGDPSFVARFRQRLDAIELERAERWRLLALRLMPLAATALIAALTLTVMENDGGSGDESFTALERTVLAAGSPHLREAVPEDAASTELLLAGAVDSRSVGGLRRADVRWP